MRWFYFVFATVLMSIGATVSMTSEARADLDSASQEALQKTQELLRSKSQREAFIQSDANAQAADARVKSLMGGQSERAYELSAQLTERLVQHTNGDAKQLEALIQSLAQNPESIRQFLTPAQINEIRSLASEIEKKSNPNPGR